MSRRPLPSRTTVLGLLAYAAVATLPLVHALRSPATRTQPDGDIPQTDWFLAWTHHAVTTGSNPFVTDAVNHPVGVNLMWNTTLPLPGLLASPVTAAWGPTAAHDLLLWIAAFGSMVAMRWCAAAVTGRRSTAWLAGLAYGCSPYLVAQAPAHLNLTLVMVPPLLARVLLELYTGRTSARTAAVRLGLLAVVQFLITEEVLVSAVVTAACTTALLALRHRRALTRPSVRRVAAALLGGAALSLVLLSVPLYQQLRGPLALSGPAAEPVSYAADVLGVLVPSRAQLLHTTWADGWSGNPSENGSFLGPVVLGLLLWSAWRYPRSRDWALLALVGWVLSLGGFARIGGHPTPIKLPFLAVWKVPLLGSLAPARFSLYAFLGVLLALVAASDSWQLPRTGRSRLVAAVVTVGAVLPLLPNWPYPFVDRRLPAWVTAGGYRELPRGSVLETYPLARHRYGSRSSSPVEWQAVAGFWYRTTAGHVITRDPDGRGTQEGGVTLWELATRGCPVPPDQVRGEWRRLQVTAVAVDPTATRAAAVEDLLTRLTGHAADERRLGMDVWRIDGRVPRPGPAARVAHGAPGCLRSSLPG